MLLDEPPRRAILRLATPTTLVMLVAATSNVLATYYVSRLGADAIAAMSLVFPIALLATTSMAGGLGAGASSAIARALGAGRRHDAGQLAEHALMLAVVLGIVFGVGIGAGAPVVFRLMGGRDAVLDGAVAYARILFGGAVITFVGSMFDSLLRGEGNVRVPATWATTSLVLQILVTPVCMFRLGLGLEGAPIAILTCQGIATLARARFVLGGQGIVKPRPWPRPLRSAPVRDLLRVGIPASLSSTVTYLGMMVLTGVFARFGTADLAAYGLGTRLDFILLTFVFGFGAAVLTLVGMATGARRSDLVLTYVVQAGIIIVGMLLVPAILLWWRPEWWLGLFTTDPTVLEVGGSYFRIVGPSYPLLGVAMVASFAFQGLGRATLPLMWMIVRVLAVVGSSVVGTRWFGWGPQAVFGTIAAGNGVSGLVLAGLFFRTVQRVRTAA